MSQASAPAPAPVPLGKPAASTVTTGSAAPDQRNRIGENVPLLLNRLQVVAVTTVVVAGLLAALLQFLAWQASGRAGENTEQVVRVQKIQSLLLRADAIATNGYLVGGLEPAEQRAAYDAAVDEVLRLVTDAADAQPADRAVLADLNAVISDYTTAVAQARDYNRQQLEIGIAYLNRAGDTLREDALPITQALVDTNAQRAVDEMDAPSPLLLLLIGLVALGALYWINRQLAQRFHRRFNVGLVAAAGVIGILAVVSSANAFARQATNDDARDGAYQEALDSAAGRTAGNNAKALESQGLINRGSGATYEELWKAQAAVVEDRAPRSSRDEWDAYADLHQRVREADDSGDWDAARDLAISTDDGSATAALDAFDSQAARVADRQGAAAADAFRSGGPITVALAVLSLLGGFLAAGAIAWGINQRRREYS